DGDPRRLHQIVWNLLSNAIKFSPVGGNVEVRLDETDDAARVSVIDEGEGIDPEFQPRLFGRFNQAEETMTRSRGGLGLGLSIVKDLVELHGGMIDFESEPGKGSCFYFEVPLGAKGEHESPTPEESLSLDGSELDGVHILIVEDDLATREFLRSLLDRAGASVAEAGSVDEALEKIDQPTPRVLISDLGLPETTGLDLIRRIDAARLPQVKIALSAYLRETQASEVLAAGFDTFLSKPIEPERLLTEIRSHLDATG
ncbi:MAG: ATP-binding protein, partial [Thermoanaerobaculia bacterium]|nr:ATP-binding protein [Thermoanaerobaculia bacterium]